MIDGVDLDQAAEELFGLMPEDFIARRDELANLAKAQGDKASAEAIKRLRKPTVAAWLANQVARERADEVEGLLEIGAELRDATSQMYGRQMRALAKHRGIRIQTLVHEGRTMAERRGRRVGEDVLRDLEGTLNAALADPAKGEQLAAGRLSERLTHTGFGDVPAKPAGGTRAGQRGGRRTATQRESGAPAAKKADDAPGLRRNEQRQRLEEQLADAWQEASDTKEARDRARELTRDIGKRHKELQRKVQRQREELQEAEAALERLAADRKRAERDEDKADAVTKQARRRVGDLQRDLDRLKG